MKTSEVRFALFAATAFLLLSSASLMCYLLLRHSKHQKPSGYTNAAEVLSKGQIKTVHDTAPEERTIALTDKDDDDVDKNHDDMSFPGVLKTTGLNVLGRFWGASLTGLPSADSRESERAWNLANDRREPVMNSSSDTSAPIVLVDALGRPLPRLSVSPDMFEENVEPLQQNKDGQPGKDAGTRATVQSEGENRGDDEKAWKQALQERAEKECLALLMADSQSTPAEPSTLIACRAVLTTKAKRDLGDRYESVVAGGDEEAGLSAVSSSFAPGKEARGEGGGGGGGGGGGAAAATTTAAESGLGGEFDRRHFATALLTPLPGTLVQSKGQSPLYVAPSPHTTASLRNEAERCTRAAQPDGGESPPVLLWRAKRTGGSTLAALFARYAFVRKLEVAGPSGRVALRACKQNAWRTAVATRSSNALYNASVSHWPFVCRPHREYANWGGLAHLFGGRRNYQEVLVARDPLARSVAIYYWLGRRPSRLRNLVGLKEPVVDPSSPPPIVKATSYAKNLPEAYTGPGSADLPRWPWHSFAWSASEAIQMLERRKMTVVVLEHYEESLVALRRVMKWPMADVLYTVMRRAGDSPTAASGGGFALPGGHATWQTWPPAAIRALKKALKHHGAVEFHEAALRRWARTISELYPEGRDSFNAELSLFRAASYFLANRCASPDGPLDIYVNNLIERARVQVSDGHTSLEYTGGGLGGREVNQNGGSRNRRHKRAGEEGTDLSLSSEDSAFTFGKSPLSIMELCVRHQYCEHVLQKKKKLLDESKETPPIFEGAGPNAISLAEDFTKIQRLKSGGAEGIEALTQLFI